MMTQVSDAQLEQRQTAPLKHGAYSFRDRGAQALKPEGRTRLMELRDQVQDREGVLTIMQEKAADSVLLFELVQSYVAREVKAGTDLTEIPGLKMLPAFFNSMQRALTTLLANIPNDSVPVNAELEKIRRVIDENDAKNTE
jgi:hypothetical protein